MPHTQTTTNFKHLTRAQAEEALYIDFEGGKGQAPVMIGVLRRPGRGPEPFVHQVVVDAEFIALAEEHRDLRSAVEVVVRRAERRNLRIVSWSRHDLRVVQALRDEDPELVARFEGRYADARGVAERWTSTLHRAEKPADGSLGGYLRFVGYEAPEEAASDQVGETIRRLRPRLRRGQSLTESQRQRWRRLLA
ncbi:MAG TPA: hypothetical protein VNM41_00090, partial [Solirubrobacterales bacterium]|nr:hypothetical protein [Solirubrobacterales bacterium]